MGCMLSHPLGRHDRDSDACSICSSCCCSSGSSSSCSPCCCDDHPIPIDASHRCEENHRRKSHYVPLSIADGRHLGNRWRNQPTRTPEQQALRAGRHDRPFYVDAGSTQILAPIAELGCSHPNGPTLGERLSSSNRLNRSRMIQEPIRRPRAPCICPGRDEMEALSPSVPPPYSP